MNLHIDRMTLRVSGLSALEGRRLAHLVGERLGEAPPLEPGAVPSLAVNIEAQPDETLDSAARRIADAVLVASARALT